jgi:hypothetical protein
MRKLGKKYDEEGKERERKSSNKKQKETKAQQETKKKRRAEERIQQEHDNERDNPPTHTCPPTKKQRPQEKRQHVHSQMLFFGLILDRHWLVAQYLCAQIWHAGSQRCRQQVCIRCHPTQFHATIAAQKVLLVSTNKHSIFAHLLPASFSTTPKDAGFQQEKALSPAIDSSR